MVVSLFDQFMSPIFFGVPLIALAITLPLAFFPKPSPRWLNNRLLTFQGWFVNQFTKDVLLPINTPGHKWALLFVGLVVFLMTMNILGLFPYTYTPTAQLSLNLGLAIPLWLGTVLVGLRNQPNHSLAHLLPEGTPTLLIPILIVIETTSLCIRPLALGVRLTANITAGHLLIHLIGLATYGLATTMPAAAVLAFALLVMLTLLEVAVALIQAYVFVLLLSLYLQENT